MWVASPRPKLFRTKLRAPAVPLTGQYAISGTDFPGTGGNTHPERCPHPGGHQKAPCRDRDGEVKGQNNGIAQAGGV